MTGYIAAFLAGVAATAILVIAAGWVRPKTEITTSKIKQKKGENNTLDTVLQSVENAPETKEKKPFLGIRLRKKKD
ncbi:MAG: hypothetical protein A2W90_18085 [Bacteroidetes bacterium GWF2_42_66]|nr:MAG: hypothetical protein A2W92_06075 [Bacteroidetes bacterium GWA2_42_15]OFX98162.1 MAG: hypothetical protein A2W89_09575 [Bacteroidetes bacterium GWE2_42_39]OFY42547.1 MAG: hypothetical protein A2W90_18085 [Bacteroidetes bacterium GWF2_42_66]HBL74263.1 hypothetical protein [Prolixibacteraceae bacterium]HCU64032.1 hypothetical protein [Prolixibacteraceae bacterium]